MSDLKGKVVKIRVLDNKMINIYTEEYYFITGKVFFHGFNECIGYNQITIGRTPIFPFDDKDIIQIFEK